MDYVAMAITLINLGMKLADQLQEQGDITPEELAEIKAHSAMLDDKWDQIAADAAARLES